MIGARVRVHLNLHRGDWSVTQRGRVVAHVEQIALGEVRFIVSAKARARVVARQCREVHAWAEGTVIAAAPAGPETEVTYNPYRAAVFTTRDGRPLSGAAVVRFAGEVFINSKGQRYRRAYAHGEG